MVLFPYEEAVKIVKDFAHLKGQKVEMITGLTPLFRLSICRPNDSGTNPSEIATPNPKFPGEMVKIVPVFSFGFQSGNFLSLDFLDALEKLGVDFNPDDYSGQPQ